jgi:hypothetical protein
MGTRRTLLAAAAALMALPPLARSGEPPAPVDDDFLEFLGSADSDDPDWNDYMASGEVDEALETSKAKAKAPPATDSKPAGKVKSDGA